MKPHALWLGRFQPPTIAHLGTAKTILSQWQRLTIGIVGSNAAAATIDPKWSSFLKKTAETSFAKGKNPFTSSEVSRMWAGCLAAQGLSERVDLKPMTQMAYQPHFNDSFPPSEFDFVEVRLTRDDPEFDRDRLLAFSHLLGRPITYVMPPFKLHNSEIRKLIGAGGREWREFIPAGAYEIFEEIDGPRRISIAV